MKGDVMQMGGAHNVFTHEKGHAFAKDCDANESCFSKASQSGVDVLSWAL